MKAKQVTGNFYERGLSCSFGYGGLFLLIISFVIMAISSRSFRIDFELLSSNGSYTWLTIGVSCLIFLFLLLSIYHFSVPVFGVFHLDENNFILELRRFGRVYQKIVPLSLSFDIVAGRSNYSRGANRVLLELVIETSGKTFSIVEDYDSASHLALPIVSKDGMFFERLYCRSTGTLEVLAETLGVQQEEDRKITVKEAIELFKYSRTKNVQD